jgi:hypothetical protein
MIKRDVPTAVPTHVEFTNEAFDLAIRRVSLESKPMLKRGFPIRAKSHRRDTGVRMPPLITSKSGGFKCVHSHPKLTFRKDTEVLLVSSRAEMSPDQMREMHWSDADVSKFRDDYYINLYGLMGTHCITMNEAKAMMSRLSFDEDATNDDLF